MRPNLKAAYVLTMRLTSLSVWLTDLITIQSRVLGIDCDWPMILDSIVWISNFDDDDQLCYLRYVQPLINLIESIT